MLDDYDDNERVLRDHIRNILYEYAFAHLTADHDQFTRDAVEELLVEALQILPLHDKNALRLPTVPWDRLTELYGLQTLAPFQEKIQITTKISQYLRHAMKFGQGPPKTERLLKDWAVTDGVVAPDRLAFTLSLRAQKSTPRLGTGQFTQALPLDHSHLVSIPPPSMSDPLVSQSDVLRLTWRIQAEEHKAVSELLRSAAALSRPGSAYNNHYLDPSAIPEQPYFLREEVFVPIFPRSQRIRGGTTQKAHILPDLRSMSDLPKKIPLAVKVEEDANDFPAENMSVVDGWQVFSSISSPPSPTSGEEDNIDQLFNLPSPDTSPLKVLGLGKMDVPPIPRTRRIKGHTLSRKLGNLESFESFLLPLTCCSYNTKDVRTSSCSVIGQPSTLEGDDLDADIATMYHAVKHGDVIMDEALDATDSLVMKVPILSPPCIHRPNGLFIPACFSDFILPSSNAQAQVSQVACHRFFKKTKGLKSLNLTLSWTPFTLVEKLPSNLMVTGSTILVDGDDMKNGLSKEHIEKEVVALLQSITLDDARSRDDERWCALDHDHLPALQRSVNDADILLSRMTRLTPPIMETVQITEHDDLDGDKENIPQTARSMEVDDVDDSGNAFDAEAQDNQPPAKRPRLEMGYVKARESIGDPRAFSPFLYPLNDEELLRDDTMSMAVEPVDHELTCQPFETHTNLQPSSPVSLTGSFNPLALESQGGLLHAHQYSHFSSATSNAHSLYIKPQALLRQTSQSRTSFLDNYCDSDVVFDEHNVLGHALGLSAFLKLRSRNFQEPEISILPSPAPLSALDLPGVPVVIPGAPPEFMDKNTLRLPQRTAPSRRHLYMASINLLQKNVLLKFLRSHDCAVDFVERDHLNGVDLILDANTAIIFTSLISLASQRESLVATVSEQSWRYNHLLVIFEAYPASCSLKKKGISDAVFNAYTPPSIKAISRFRRDLSLAEACEKKNASCSVQIAFANNVQDSASLARYFGDIAELRDSTLWDERSWLDGDVPPEEDSLAAVPRMNQFAAYVILCQLSVDDFLALAPEERLDMFSLLVGECRITSLNAFIEERTQQLETSNSSTISS